MLKEVAQSLSEKYSQKLAEQREVGEAHARMVAMRAEEDLRRELQSARATEEYLRARLLALEQSKERCDSPYYAGGGETVAELAAKFAQLEAGVDAFLQFSCERERILNETIAQLSRAVRRRDRYIELCDHDEEVLEDRILKLEGRVRGVVESAREWNAKERKMLAMMREESALVTGLVQREKVASDNARNTKAALDRAQKAVADLTQEVNRLQAQLAEERADSVQLSSHSPMVPVAPTASPMLSPRTAPASSPTPAHLSVGATVPSPASAKKRIHHQRIASVGGPRTLSITTLSELQALSPAYSKSAEAVITKVCLWCLLCCLC